MIRYLLILLLLAGCKTPPPDRPYASDEPAPVTEQPRDERPAPAAPPKMYRYYTNAADDRLVEGPPVVPNYGPFPIHRSPPAVSNWYTPKAMAVQPKPMTNQIPGSVILSRITTTGSDGKPFTAMLEMHGEQTIQANGQMAVLIFSIHHKDYQIEFCTNLTDGVWHPMASGTGQDTNSALIIVDLYPTNQPIKFYRQNKL